MEGCSRGDFAWRPRGADQALETRCVAEAQDEADLASHSRRRGRAAQRRRITGGWPARIGTHVVLMVGRQRHGKTSTAASWPAGPARRRKCCWPAAEPPAGAITHSSLGRWLASPGGRARRRSGVVAFTPSDARFRGARQPSSSTRRAVANPGRADGRAAQGGRGNGRRLPARRTRLARLDSTVGQNAVAAGQALHRGLSPTASCHQARRSARGLAVCAASSTCRSGSRVGEGLTISSLRPQRFAAHRLSEAPENAAAA